MNNRSALYLLLTIQMIIGAHGQNVPTSARADEVIKRISPALKTQLMKKDLKLGNPIFLRFFKDSMRCEVWMQAAPGSPFTLFKSYPIATYGGRGFGPKLREGDGKAPEGFYYVTPGQMNPRSSYHLSFNLGYPNRYDRAHGRTGSFLMVHGKRQSIGCYAMTDPQIEEIYTLADRALRNGQPYFRVHLFPFELSSQNIKKHTRNPLSKTARWKSFWMNLKEGYDFFEKYKTPPNIEVDEVKKRYLIGE